MIFCHYLITPRLIRRRLSLIDDAAVASRYFHDDISPRLCCRDSCSLHALSGARYAKMRLCGCFMMARTPYHHTDRIRGALRCYAAAPVVSGAVRYAMPSRVYALLFIERDARMLPVDKLSALSAPLSAALCHARGAPCAFICALQCFIDISRFFVLSLRDARCRAICCRCMLYAALPATFH